VYRQPLLSVEELRVHFWTSRGIVHAVNGISFDIAPGETLGIVGESGCGKSVTSLALMGILPRAGRAVGGRALFQGRDLLALSDAELRGVRGKEIAMIFQDPMTSLNPVLTVGRQIREALETHFKMERKAAEVRTAELLDRVGIPSPKLRLKDYPHQFSGGMRQRAMIAMALACEPKLLIADEPTTALDVTIQAQILDLLRELVRERQTALILITHDLGVVAGMCERVNVMYGGMFMETGAAEQLFARPRHPYTLGLLQSVPRLDARRRDMRWRRHGAKSRRLSRSSPATASRASTRFRLTSGTAHGRSRRDDRESRRSGGPEGLLPDQERHRPRSPRRRYPRRRRCHVHDPTR
jgi:ABC-type dipeptide/oligopeptide/nickel transport system ATPase component